MTDDLHDRAIANTIGWLLKIHGISEADAAARVDCAMKSPLPFKLPTFKVLDAMPVDPDDDPFAIISQTCKRPTVRYDNPGVQIVDLASDCGGHCFGCMRYAEGELPDRGRDETL
jgi:hypothetical protein